MEREPDQEYEDEKDEAIFKKLVEEGTYGKKLLRKAMRAAKVKEAYEKELQSPKLTRDQKASLIEFLDGLPMKLGQEILEIGRNARTDLLTKRGKRSF